MNSELLKFKSSLKDYEKSFSNFNFLDSRSSPNRNLSSASSSFDTHSQPIVGGMKSASSLDDIFLSLRTRSVAKNIDKNVVAPKILVNNSEPESISSLVPNIEQASMEHKTIVDAETSNISVSGSTQQITATPASSVSSNSENNSEAASSGSSLDSIPLEDNDQVESNTLRNDNSEIEEPIILKGGPVRKSLFVGQLAVETTEVMLLKFVKQNKNIDLSKLIKVRKLNFKDSRDYSSFVVSLSEENYEVLSDRSLWPSPVVVHEWKNRIVRNSPRTFRPS